MGRTSRGSTTMRLAGLPGSRTPRSSPRISAGRRAATSTKRAMSRSPAFAFRRRRGRAVSTPGRPGGASSNGASFSVSVRGAWSLATASIRPSTRARQRASRSSGGRRGGFTFPSVLRRRFASRSRWCGVASVVNDVPESASRAAREVTCAMWTRTGRSRALAASESLRIADDSASDGRAALCSSREVPSWAAIIDASSAWTVARSPVTASEATMARWPASSVTSRSPALCAVYIFPGAPRDAHVFASRADRRAPYSPKSTFAFRRTARTLSSNAARLVTGGFVFGMSNTAVTPPIAAAVVPVKKSSASVLPGSRKWTWRSTPPGRIRRLPKSRCSSPSSVFAILTMRPSVMPTASGSRPPRKKTRPSRTSMLRPRPSDDRTPRRGLRPDLRLEPPDPRVGLEPRVRQEARLHARLREELLDVPVPRDWHLGQEQSAVAAAAHDEPVRAQADLLHEVLRLLPCEKFRRREDGHLDDDRVQLLRCLQDRLRQGEDRRRVADAPAQLFCGIRVDRHEHAIFAVERCGDLDGRGGFAPRVRVDRSAGHTDGKLALCIRVHRPGHTADRA